jgi:AMP-binding enzyme
LNVALLGDLAQHSTRTLGEAHLAGERCKRATVIGGWVDGRREEEPSWRFYRNVIRMGLYLSERAQLKSGHKVVSLAPLGRERFILEWAVLAQGAISVALDPAMSGEELRAAMRDLAPRYVVAAGPDELAKLEAAGGATGVERLLVLDAAARSPAAVAWDDAMGLGGTLDTAERAQSFRARARELDATRPALALRDFIRGAGWTFMSHADVLSAITTFRSRVSPAPGDVAYFLGRGISPGARIALLSFVADGCTSTFVGTRGREFEELAQVRPQILMAPASVAARVRDEARPRGGRAVRAWLEHRLRWRHGEPLARSQYKAIMTPDGAPVGPLEETNGR